MSTPERPTKLIGNAGDQPFTYTATVEGFDYTWTLAPGEGIEVPLSDDELAAYTASKSTPAPVTLPGPGALITQPDGTPAIVTRTDPATNTVTVVPLPGQPVSIAAADLIL